MALLRPRRLWIWISTRGTRQNGISWLYPLAQIGGVAAAGGGPIYLAFADGALRSLDAYTGKIATLLPPGAQHWSALTLSMDGRRLFLGSRQGGVFLWELDR